MSKQTTKETEKQNAIDQLRQLLPPGTIVYTILRHVSRSGMFRVIDAVIKSETGITHVSAYLLEQAGFFAKYDSKRCGWKVSGCGMDMGFHLVYSLSSLMYRDGFTCIGEKCPSNDHSNGDRNYEAHHHESGGYALRQAWL